MAESVYPMIKTARGTEIPIASFGVSSLDGLLRIWIPNADLSEMMRTFLDPEHLPITVHEDPDLDPVDFSLYTVFRGAEVDFVGSVMLVLGRI